MSVEINKALADDLKKIVEDFDRIALNPSVKKTEEANRKLAQKRKQTLETIKKVGLEMTS